MSIDDGKFPLVGISFLDVPGYDWFKSDDFDILWSFTCVATGVVIIAAMIGTLELTKFGLRS